MNTCPNCAKERPEGEAVCRACGHTAGATTNSAPALVVTEPVRPRDRRRLIRIVAGTIMIATFAVMVTMRPRLAPVPQTPGPQAPARALPQPEVVTAGAPARTSPAPNAPAAPAAPNVQTANAPAPKLPTPTASVANAHATNASASSSSAPKWIRSRQSAWATDGSRTVAFELKAEREVPVWMRRVVPTLAVRCLGRQIEVFVVTEWPASLEDRPDKHTVSIALDGEANASELWESSQDNQTLFAPDGAAFARRMVKAKTLRFGFSPYNAPPTSAEFDLTGIDKLAPQVAKTCGRAI